MIRLVKLLKGIKNYFLEDGNPVDVPQSKSAIQLLEEAKKEWQCAREYFNNVSDPELVDYAIFSVQAAEKRYEYLLKKEKQVNKEKEYILKRNE
ncbi:DUF2508 family protein [Proteinivorax hydrogeniformans]|uniref:DUF2508 family protein n=1 Tax=Proteinivorax hydrogeniformans TaxID=1826727 RepID=A0AAU8HU03_9FIRM